MEFYQSTAEYVHKINTIKNYKIILHQETDGNRDNKQILTSVTSFAIPIFSSAMSVY